MGGAAGAASIRAKVEAERRREEEARLAEARAAEAERLAAIPTAIRTGLADVSLGPQGSGAFQQEFRDLDELIQARTDPALALLTGGSEEAVRLSQLAQQAGAEPLEPFFDLQAFEEQQALLGTRGEEAQAAAISGIPLSDFDRELLARQERGLLRQASARGELGSGATILAGQQLAGQQQSNIIQRRLSELEPLVAASRGIASTLSALDESSRGRQAGIQSALGPQIANIRLGAAAPLVQSTLQQGELSGLRRIGEANVRGQTLQQLSGLAGQFSGGFQSTTTPSTPTIIPQQQGFTNPNFSPVGGNFSPVPQVNL